VLVDSSRDEERVHPAEFVARSRVLALVVLAGSVALVALLLILPFTMEHSLEGAQLLIWGSLILIVTLIIGISLVYAYISRYISLLRWAEVQVETRSGRGSPEDTGEVTLRLLPEDERAVYRRLLHEGGEVLQKDLRRMLPFSGPKLTRVLDRLERKGLVVRERYGMTNRVRLKEREA
jgi:uncharacterized membrane protein